MNNPFDYIPDEACEEAFGKLVERIEQLKLSSRPEDIRFCRELVEGKMLGILIATDNIGISHTLYAFSGQSGDEGFFHDGFVGPVFDYLQPGGYFKSKEGAISLLNREIREFEEGPLTEIQASYNCEKARLEADISEFKDYCRRSKAERERKRENGLIDETERERMIRQSQFEKAELRRMKKRMSETLEQLATSLNFAQQQLEDMKRRRREESERLQKWLFDNFTLLNARGESRSLSDIFAETAFVVPPSGAGECCAPKLLQEAYRRGWTPLSMAEYWYGRPKGGEIRRHGQHYPACRGKCLPILEWMLQGLKSDSAPIGPNRDHTKLRPEVIYENSRFCVVNKPSGMLSVPGKSHAKSVQDYLQELFGPDRLVRMAHRLDRDTSGLIVAAFDPETLKVLRSLFATRRVKKTYIAVLEGDYVQQGLPREGHIELPLSPDILDRPRQFVDVISGKTASTYYEFTEVTDGRSRVIFRPKTGRTHQLRVHAASELGLGMPIVGDPLYGISNSEGDLGAHRDNVHPHDKDRLHLHAERLEFFFPLDSRTYSFYAPVPF